MDNRTEPKEASLLVRGLSRHRIVGAITASRIFDKGCHKNEREHESFLRFSDTVTCE